MSRALSPLEELRRVASRVEQHERSLKIEMNDLRAKVSQLRSSERGLQRLLEEERSVVAELKEKEAKDDGEKKALQQSIIELTSEVIALRLALADQSQLSMESKEDEDTSMISTAELLNAAEKGQEGVVWEVLKPQISQKRKGELGRILGLVLVDLCVTGELTGDLIENLLAKGADLKVQKSWEQGGRSALHVAAAKGQKDVLHLLLKENVEIDCLDAQGRTPLHLAAKLRKSETARLLLRKGADPELKTPEGLRPVDMAKVDDKGAWFSLSFNSMSVEQVFESPALRFWNASARGLRKYKEEKFEESMAMFSTAIELQNSHGSNRVGVKDKDLSRLFFNRAKAGMKLGEVLQAQRDCDAALSLDEDYRNAMEIRAECNFSLFEFAKATADFEELSNEEISFQVKYFKAKRHRDAKAHEILGIPRGSTTSEIQKGFRKASIRFHPDKWQMSEEDAYRAGVHFQSINEARKNMLQRANSYSWQSDSEDDDEDDFHATTTGFAWETMKSLAEQKASFISRQAENEKLMRKKEEASKKEQELRAAQDAAATAESLRLKTELAPDEIFEEQEEELDVNGEQPSEEEPLFSPGSSLSRSQKKNRRRRQQQQQQRGQK